MYKELESVHGLSNESMTDNFILRIVLVVVDTNNVHGRIRRRRGDDNFLGTSLQVGGSSGIISGPHMHNNDNTYFSMVVKTP